MNWHRRGLWLPYVLVISDTLNTVLQQAPPDVDFSGYRLSSDNIRLSIDANELLTVHFDDSQFGMFRQSRNMLFISFGVALFVTAILAYLLHTVFLQKKMAEEKEKISNGIVHDLRNPVAFIKSMLSTLKEGAHQQKHIQNMEYENERLSMMIENLLCVSTTEQKQFIHKKNILLYPYIKNIIDRYKNLYGKTLNICFVCDNTSITARIDPFHLGNAIMNLLDNAIKYSKGVPDICVECYQKDDRIHILVRDQGIGIPARYIHRIFKKHYRVPYQDSLEKTGFGLGLYYVKTVVNKYGGDVFVKSEYNKGSEFAVTIPANTN